MEPSFRRLSAAGASALSIWELTASQAVMQDLLGVSLPTTVDKMVLVRNCFAFDEALCWCRDIPQSDGGRFLIEVHLHGGFGVAAALRKLLAAKGWHEAVVPSVETDALLLATSPLAARIFAARRNHAWQQRLTQLAATEISERGPAIAALQRWNDWGQILAHPPMLLLAGPANSGKSTLFNAWLQERRATASAAAGTTRDLVSVPCQLGVGAESFVVDLVDSAGLWEQAQGVDQAAVAMSLAAIDQAWRVIWLLDAVSPPSSTVLAAIAARSHQDPLVVSRCDLAAGWNPQRILPRAFFSGQQQDLPGLRADLENMLLNQLGTPPPVGQLVAVSAAERDELHALAVRQL